MYFFVDLFLIYQFLFVLLDNVAVIW